MIILYNSSFCLMGRHRKYTKGYFCTAEVLQESSLLHEDTFAGKQFYTG